MQSKKANQDYDGLLKKLMAKKAKNNDCCSLLLAFIPRESPVPGQVSVQII